ncbi:molybdopterin biosynthesis protein MoeE [Prosthecochloris sp. ZM]|uniref:molybdenum cofactor biosynthesis protein MoaE n=1 Tax=unclassified Prosthecochloris TaxID=2632826 RepID=UPI000DF7E23A|nr:MULTISPECIES: molybdenum cofactor biosynthesis protein MoaE [unclassified Prosthecochloris]NEX11222.1 molybdopterin biosynthesis protein MoeE [Prosthecochloris sp.]RDD29352.1 molybdopterin biosynthesis protein MoeE [Prosthecochloris sp. ZM]
MISVHITSEKIDGWRGEFPGDPSEGSEVIFTGLVRDKENGRRIAALVYEHYEGMAQKELEKLARGAVDRFAIASLCCRHRIGTIPVGEAAIVVIMRSSHRKEGFSAMSWFMDELKKVVPIWKVGSIEAEE